AAESAANYSGGDFAGVIQKLEEGYFESLGVTTLWLSPAVDNADSAELRHDGHLGSGYDGSWPKEVGQVEPRFGTECDLQELVELAHRQGMSVVLDHELGYVHASSPVFADNADWFS